VENRELLNAVLLAPDDDAPRHLYAEWLGLQPDEPSKARAAFIKAQLAVAQAGTLSDRLTSEHLASRYGTEWAGLIARLVTRFRFDRGFIENVTLDAGEFLERAPILFSEAPVRHLDLTGVVAAARTLFLSPSLEPIRSLDLSRNGLTDEHVMLLAASPVLKSLRWLSLADNRIGAEGALALARSPLSEQLVYVAFHGNPFEPNERYSHDDGFVVDSWMPEDGVALESAYGGELRWLRHAARTIEDSVPNRFRAQPQSSGVR
jgi:uncharacterized protein (TIGR02996 family)